MPVEDVLSAESGRSDQLASYTCWRFPAQSLETFIDPVLYRATVNAVLVASRGKRPSEIGGVLLGTAATEKGRRSIVINEIIGVGSEKQLFNTTYKDAAALQAAVQNPAGLEDMKLVGYFRSHMREGATISPQDKVFFEKHLGTAPGVFLVMKPAGGTSWAPHLYLWNGETLQLEPAEAASAKAITDALTNKMVLSSAGDSVMADASVPAKQQRSPAKAPGANVPFPVSMPENGTAMPNSKAGEESGSSPWFQRHLSSVAIFAIACVAGFFGRPLVQTYVRGITARSDSTLIGLHVVRGPGGELNLTWNRHLTGLSPQQTASLTIQDGPLHRNVSIDSEQLRFGRLTYFAETDDVQFHLEISLGEDRSLTENLHVVAPGNAMAYLGNSYLNSAAREQGIIPGGRSPYRSAAISETLQPAGLVASSAVAATKPLGLGLDIGKDSIPTDGPAALGDVALGSAEVPMKNLELSLRPYSPPSHLTSDITRVESPTIAWNGSAQTFEIRNNLPEEAPPAVEVKTFAPAPAPTQPRRVALPRVPPRPLRQVLPETHEFGRTLFRDAVDLEVEVAINDKGRVVSAHSVPAKGANSFLVAQALAAAKQWTFDPAKLGGEPVSSVYTIVFQFRP